MAALRARAVEIDQPRLYTTEEFMNLVLDEGQRYELVEGVIEEMSQPGVGHGIVCDNLYGELRVYVRAKHLGRVLPPTSYDLKLRPDKDTVRAPDISFISADRTAEIGIDSHNGAIPFPPALAVEVLSPNDRPGELHKKLQDYQAAGWNLVWVISPEKRKVDVYRLQQSLKPTQSLTVNEELSGEDVLPGFSMSVQALFEQ
jgi:Uma2 family endonuclease